MDTSESVVKRQNTNCDSYNYEWAIALNRIIMKLYGLWPDPNATVRIRVQSNVQLALVVIYITFMVIIPQISALIITWGDFMVFMDIILVKSVILLSVIKLLCLRYKKAALQAVFKIIAEDWSSSVNEYEKYNLIKYWSRSQKLTIIGNCIIIVNVAVYHSPAVAHLGFVMRSLSNLTDIPGRSFTYISAYPFDVKPLYIFQLIACGQLVCAYFACVGFTICDLLFATIVFHATAQMKNLANKIHHMLDNRCNDFKTVLPSVVKSHNRIIDLVNKIGGIFNVLLLGLFLSFMLAFCTHGFCIVNLAAVPVPKFQHAYTTLFSILHGTFLVFHVFLMTWAGQELITQSEEVYCAIYSCNWFQLTPKEKMIIIFLLIRAKHSLVINAGYFIPMTFNTFTQLIKTCGGYISVLLAMRK